MDAGKFLSKYTIACIKPKDKFYMKQTETICCDSEQCFLLSLMEQLQHTVE